MAPDDVEFEREKLCYIQNCEMFRSLNQIMWQVPLIAISLTGGLWFGVTVLHESKIESIGILTMADSANFCLIAILIRIRYVMSQYLDGMKRFSERSYISADGEGLFERSRVVIHMFSAMLGIAGSISLTAVILLWIGVIGNRVCILVA